nr:MAG TPA: holin family protein [Caudoviricetes sp.]
MSMPFDEAQRIAESQFTWEILFIILFVVVVGFLVRTSDKREKKLMDFHEQSKVDSRKREDRLMEHLEKTTSELGVISDTVSDIQREMVRMNNRMDDLEEKGEKE